MLLLKAVRMHRVAWWFLVVSDTILDHVYKFFASRHMQNWREHFFELWFICLTFSLRRFKRYLHPTLLEKIAWGWVLQFRSALGGGKTVWLILLIIRYYCSVNSRFVRARTDLTFKKVVAPSHRRLNASAGNGFVFFVVAEITHVRLHIVDVTIIAGKTSMVLVNISVPARSIKDVVCSLFWAAHFYGWVRWDLVWRKVPIMNSSWREVSYGVAARVKSNVGVAACAVLVIKPCFGWTKLLYHYI